MSFFKRLAIFLGISMLMTFQYSVANTKTSQFGKYQGWTEEVYSDYVRTSDYLTLSDGNRLAYDLLLPTNNKKVSNRSPLPVLFCYTSYLRAYNMVVDGKIVENEIVNLNIAAKIFVWLRSRLFKNGHIFDQAFMNKWLKRMLRHGYAIVIVEQRGTGASEGTMIPVFKYQAKDADEVMNWIAAQPWSNGNIGMFGKSSLAMAQYAAASMQNPHLKAIFPVSSSIDMYSAVWFPGGILNQAFSKVFAHSTGLLEEMAVPVDSDADGAVLEKILQQRRQSFNLSEGPEKAIQHAPFRDSDSLHPKGGKIWEDLGIYTLLERVNQSDTAVYNVSGWFDIFIRDAILLHNNLSGSHKLLIRPLSHFNLDKRGDDLDIDAEAYRWFDFWLKGIPNGIMDEPSIHYNVPGLPKDRSWHSTTKWPLANEKKTRFYFSSSEIQKPKFSGQGKVLTREAPHALDAFDSYLVDYSTTTGKHSRWNSIIQDMEYPDMADNDLKSLTYTSKPLKKDMVIAGHPIVHLLASAKVPDLDIFVYLEEIDSSGKSQYITEGCLRASHRTLGKKDFLNSGLPYHSFYKKDIIHLPPEKPTELVFDLFPTAYTFSKGNKIRIAIACGDSDNFKTPKLDPAPEIHIFRSQEHASFVELPIIL